MRARWYWRLLKMFMKGDSESTRIDSFTAWPSHDYYCNCHSLLTWDQSFFLATCQVHNFMFSKSKLTSLKGIITRLAFCNPSTTMVGLISYSLEQTAHNPPLTRPSVWTRHHDLRFKTSSRPPPQIDNLSFGQILPLWHASTLWTKNCTIYGRQDSDSYNKRLSMAPHD